MVGGATEIGSNVLLVLLLNQIPAFTVEILLIVLCCTCGLQWQEIHVRKWACLGMKKDTIKLNTDCWFCEYIYVKFVLLNSVRKYVL